MVWKCKNYRSKVNVKTQDRNGTKKIESKTLIDQATKYSIESFK